MTRVVITGAGSYLGAHIAAELAAFPERFTVRELDMRGAWDKSALDGADAVVHVAGLAHQKETAENADEYDAVNHVLAVETAREAKARGVKQFIFFSSMSVYGLSCGRITAETQPSPSTWYGRSKWAAEQALAEWNDDTFRVAVLRPPMIYGRGCRGNYPRLAALAQSLPVFPRVQNQRSMLYIGTLCTFVRRLIESGQSGLYFPQNREYVSTCDMVREIARCHGRKVHMVPGLGWLVSALASRVGVVGKVFGTLTYDKAMSTAFADAQEMAFAQTISQTEVGA